MSPTAASVWIERAPSRLLPCRSVAIRSNKTPAPLEPPEASILTNFVKSVSTTTESSAPAPNLGLPASYPFYNHTHRRPAPGDAAHLGAYNERRSAAPFAALTMSQLDHASEQGDHEGSAGTSAGVLSAWEGECAWNADAAAIMAVLVPVLQAPPLLCDSEARCIVVETLLGLCESSSANAHAFVGLGGLAALVHESRQPDVSAYTQVRSEVAACEPLLVSQFWCQLPLASCLLRAVCCQLHSASCEASNPEGRAGAVCTGALL